MGKFFSTTTLTPACEGQDIGIGPACRQALHKVRPSLADRLKWQGRPFSWLSTLPTSSNY